MSNVRSPCPVCSITIGICGLIDSPSGSGREVALAPSKSGRLATSERQKRPIRDRLEMLEQPELLAESGAREALWKLAPRRNPFRLKLLALRAVGALVGCGLGPEF
jgi:hypothetical protein